jgi:hypothetical protein
MPSFVVLREYLVLANRYLFGHQPHHFVCNAAVTVIEFCIKQTQQPAAVAFAGWRAVFIHALTTGLLHIALDNLLNGLEHVQ